MSLLFVDTETTGLDPKKERIIEIACYQTNTSGQVLEKHFHHYLNPQCPISYGATKVHGITNDQLQDKPLFADIATPLLEFLRGKTLIIHNAPFDVSFIEAELKRCNHKIKKLNALCTIIDSLTLSRKKHAKGRHNLDALCNRYHINTSHRNLHGAMLDAKLLAQVYFAMVREQDNLMPSTKKQSAPITQQATMPKKQSPQSPLRHASPQELQAHQAMITLLKKHNPEYCWPS
jgi:DNA polymerase III subunit epsilon